MDALACLGCGIVLPSHDGPVHPYMTSSPACWAKYGEVLAREFGNAEYRRAHRLTVDAYAVQHPGCPSRQSTQSVAVHLISLHAVLELGWNHQRATALIRAAADHGQFVWLEPPKTRGVLNILHVVAAHSSDMHVTAVHEWASAAWAAWEQHHQQVRAWAAMRAVTPNYGLERP